MFLRCCSDIFSLKIRQIQYQVRPRTEAGNRSQHSHHCNSLRQAARLWSLDGLAATNGSAEKTNSAITWVGVWWSESGVWWSESGVYLQVSDDRRVVVDGFAVHGLPHAFPVEGKLLHGLLLGEVRPLVEHLPRRLVLEPRHVEEPLRRANVAIPAGQEARWLVSSREDDQII